MDSGVPTKSCPAGQHNSMQYFCNPQKFLHETARFAISQKSQSLKNLGHAYSIWILGINFNSDF